MAFSASHGEARFRFDAGEFAGALGDSVTVVPLVVALGVLTPASLPHVLLLFGVFQVVWGVAYGIPLSVEPMKALAGLTIAGTLSYGELVAAGLLAGVVLVLAGRFGALGRVERLVGEPVVRGVQLAVALMLAATGVGLVADAPLVAGGTLLVVAGCVAVGFGRASVLAALGIGLALAVAAVGVPAPSAPSAGLFPGGGPLFTLGAAEGLAAQLAMTVGNAAVATSLLCSDLFDRRVSPDDLSKSMGVMCLTAVPLGGLPMCHGSGGLAGKYAFGARTAGANVVLGALYVGAAFLAGLVVAFPTAVLGVLLFGVAAQLARSALRTDALGTTLLIGALGAAVDIGVAFVLGATAYALLRRSRNSNTRESR